MDKRWHVSEVGQDLSHGWSHLLRRPAFALLAIATLAVGIGAATAIFSAADHVLLRPLPYRDIDRVTTLWETDEKTGERTKPVSPGNFLDWKDRLSSFEALGLAEPYSFDLTGEGSPEPLRAWLVSEDYFKALGVRPLLGRAFAHEEYREDPQVVMLSYSLWQRRFAGDRAVVGRKLQLDFKPTTIVGVLPRGAIYPEARELYAPKWLSDDDREDRSGGYMFAVGRLRAGKPLAAARSEAASVAKAIAAENPESNEGVSLYVLPLKDRVLAGVRTALLVLLGAVGFLLVIACTNVASLLLARGIERERELSVRAALGASRPRLIRQLVTESLLLGLLGCAAGLALALLGVKVISRLAPPDLPRIDTIGLDGRVLVFSFALSVLAALLFGFSPALRYSQPGVSAAIAGSRSHTLSRSGLRLRSLLVVGEIALALVLLVSAGLLARSFVRLLENKLGFEVGHRASLQIFLWDSAPTVTARIERVQALTERFGAIPGVDGVGVTSALPFHPSQIDVESEIEIDGRANPPGLEYRAQATVASPRYFKVMGIPLLRGRAFTEADAKEAPQVAILSESLARRIFPNGDPVGQKVTFGVMGRPLSREIVGVVGGVRPTTLDSAPREEIYVPYAQSGTGSATFVVRTRGDAAAVLPAMREIVWELNPTKAIYHTGTLEEMMRATLVERRFNLALLAAFSVVAFALAAIGIYGLISFSAGLRRNELGVRLALGGNREQIIGLFLRQGLLLGVVGTAIGIAASLGLTRFLASMLYGVEAKDPMTLGGSAVTMLLIAGLASTVPAWRASRADPAEALRAD